MLLDGFHVPQNANTEKQPQDLFMWAYSYAPFTICLICPLSFSSLQHTRVIVGYRLKLVEIERTEGDNNPPPSLTGCLTCCQQGNPRSAPEISAHWVSQIQTHKHTHGFTLNNAGGSTSSPGQTQSQRTSLTCRHRQHTVCVCVFQSDWVRMGLWSELEFSF